MQGTFDRPAQVITISRADTIKSAAAKMSANNVGCLVVNDENGNFAGIVTERDLLKKILSVKQDPEKINVEDIMSKKVVSVDVKTSLLEISKIMTKNIMRRVLVTENDKFIGIVTSRDLLQLMAG